MSGRKKVQRPHDPARERWWAEYEHDEFGFMKVGFRWEYRGHGIYQVVPTEIEFDLFIPQDEQEALLQVLQRTIVRTLTDEKPA